MNSTSNEMRHETVYFTGHVQGVGFRQETLSIAREFDVAGRVQNLDDGRVQLDAEGSPRDIDAFIKAIDERMHGYIRKTERTSRPAPTPPQFSGFQIQ
ncbi:acylphosphatase [Opitutaceae bacterium TAV4]|uniref:acylphosphatase n=1 Tax=Geminisphaera colitermitum TaxID=1148786 RepID=UPI0001965188|nr:acylphosphatase [Geminisphaera colitermitum]RRJ95098.1 acylphosphatase [Opitutaceae bacterium TAV4]RRJ99355.1 acylphosphatase [Opitutaceae bacterium TAV3]